MLASVETHGGQKARREGRAPNPKKGREPGGEDDGAWEPVDFIPKHVKVWRLLALAQLTLKRVKGYWSELGRYLQHVKCRIKDLD